jgi:hypothetical protein
VVLPLKCPLLWVLGIRDVSIGSCIWFFSIQDPGSELSPSRFSDPGSAAKNLSILTRRKHSKCVLSFTKYDHGFLSPIPDPGSGCWLSTHPRSRIPDPSSRGQKPPDTGFGFSTLFVIFRKQTVKDGPISTPSSFQNFKFKCAFMTCGTIFNTPSQLKRHLFRHHPDVKKDCIYNGCTYSTYNINTLRVCHF